MSFAPNNLIVCMMPSFYNANQNKKKKNNMIFVHEKKNMFFLLVITQIYINIKKYKITHTGLGFGRIWQAAGGSVGKAWATGVEARGRSWTWREDLRLGEDGEVTCGFGFGSGDLRMEQAGLVVGDLEKRSVKQLLRWETDEKRVLT